VTCAVTELAASLEDRHRPAIQTATTHYSEHALGAIVLIVCAFEAWLRESIRSLGMGSCAVLRLADREPVESYERVGKLAGSPFIAGRGHGCAGRRA
jgi:hypothetical protein